ncbi:hypothetical protein V2A60_000507 [Cordyceps javanica]
MRATFGPSACFRLDWADDNDDDDNNGDGDDGSADIVVVALLWPSKWLRECGRVERGSRVRGTYGLHHAVIADMRKRYRNQKAQIRRLGEDNEQKCQSSLAFIGMAAMVAEQWRNLGV